MQESVKTILLPPIGGIFEGKLAFTMVNRNGHPI